MIKNKKFIHLNDAFNYSKHNGFKILAINIKYFDAKINNYQVDKMNYLCLNETDYYKFIKKDIDKKKTKDDSIEDDSIEVDNDKFNRTEKIYNNFNFEVLTNNKRKLYFDIDKTPKRDIIKAIDLLKSQVKEHLNIVDEPLIFIRENYFKIEDDNELCSVHIIYNNYSIDYLQQNHLIKFIQLSFLDIDLNIDTSIYTKNRLYNLPYNTKQKYITNFFIPFNDYTKELYDKDINNCLINNTNDTELIVYEKKFIKETNKDNNDYEVITSDNQKLIDDLIERLPNEFYKNNNLWKLLIHYLYTNGYDYIKFMKHSAKMINRDDKDESIYDYIQTKIKVLFMNTNHIFNVIANKYNIYFEFNKHYTLDFIKWVSEMTGIDEKKLISKIDDYYEKNANKKSQKKIKLNGFILLLSSQILLSNKTFYYYPIKKVEPISNYKRQSEVIDIKALQEHIKNISDKKLYRLCGVNAKYGSGKSFYIVMELLKKTNYKILMLTDNNALNSENLLKYKEFGARNHQELQDNLITLQEFNEARVAICSPESINKLYNNYDIIILDEYETLTNHYSSETMNKKKSSDYDKFIKIKQKLLNSKSIFCLDADLSLERMSIIENIIDCKAKLFYCENNNFKDTDHNIYYSRTEFIAKIYDDLNDNKRVSICSNGKKELILYKKLITEKFTKRMMIITSDEYVKLNNCNVELLLKKEVLKNLEQTIIDYDIEVLLYSSTIKTGISINKPLFNKLYAIGYNLNVCNSREFIQMLYRNRNLIDDTINIHFKSFYNKYSNGTNKKLLEFNLKALLQQKYKNNFNIDNLDKDYFNLRLLNDMENEYSKNCFNQETITRLIQHGFKINLIYNDFSNKEINKLYTDLQVLLKQETLNKITKLSLIDQEQYEIIHNQETKTEQDCLLIDKYFLYKNSGIEQYKDKELFFDDKRDTLTTDIHNNMEYIETLIKNKDLIDRFKLYDDRFINNDTQYIDNNDKKYIQGNILNEVLGFFGCDNFYNEICIDKLTKIILNNKSYIQKNFNHYQSILIETKDINYEIETKDDLLIKNVISLLKRLGDYGVYCGYLSSGNMYYDNKYFEYKYNHKDNARLSNNKSIFYIVNKIKHLFNFNNYYFNYLHNNIKKVYIDDKIFIENGEKSIINKKIIKTSNNKIVENGKRTRAKMLIETEEQLFYNKINLYDNKNECGIIKSKFVERIQYNNIKSKVTYDGNRIELKLYLPKLFDNIIEDTSNYVEEPKIKEIKEFYTNKKLPIINKCEYQGFTIDKNNYKIMNYDLKKQIHYAIHINPFIKHKNIYRPFYKDWFILQKDYKEYLDNILYVNETLDIKIDYDKEYITEYDLKYPRTDFNIDNYIINNYEPNNKLVNNFIPIKIYRYGINSIILYKNAITNEPIPSYNKLKKLKENCNNYDTDEDDIDIESVKTATHSVNDNKKFEYNLNNVIDIVNLLIEYKTNKDYTLLIKIKNIIQDDNEVVDYDNYYEEFIKLKRDMFYEYSKKDINLWSNLVYKLYK